MDQISEKRFRELWDFAKANYSLPGNGMNWFCTWINSLKVSGNGDYNLMKPAYECVSEMVRKSWVIWSLDGWVETEVMKSIPERTDNLH